MADAFSAIYRYKPLKNSMFFWAYKIYPCYYPRGEGLLSPCRQAMPYSASRLTGLGRCTAKPLFALSAFA